jgi:hypothetical protein
MSPWGRIFARGYDRFMSAPEAACPAWSRVSTQLATVLEDVAAGLPQAPAAEA